MPDRGPVFAGVILQKKPLKRRLDGGVEPAVVAEKNQTFGPVGVEPLAGPFVADSDPVLCAPDSEGAGVVSRPVVRGSVEKDPVDPSTRPVGERVGLAEGDQDRFVGDLVVSVMEEIGGVAVLTVCGEIEGPQNDIDLSGALPQRLQQSRFPVEKERQDRFGKDHQPIAPSDRLVDLFKDGSDLGAQMLRVPFEIDGDAGRHQPDFAGRVFGEDAGLAEVQCREKADEGSDREQNSAGTLLSFGEPKGGEDQQHSGQHGGEGEFVHPEPAVDEGKFGFEPVEAEGMDIAHT